MKSSDLFTVLGFMILALCIGMLGAIELEKAKCKHIEIGPITHDLPLDVN